MFVALAWLARSSLATAGSSSIPEAHLILPVDSSSAYTAPQHVMPGTGTSLACNECARCGME